LLTTRHAAAWLAGTWLVFVAAVYLPDVGRGFVRDDFGFIEAGRAALTNPAQGLLPQHPGFYRPLVTATFSVDYQLHGLHARGYGFSNLLLYVACAAAIGLLARRIGLTARAAILAAFVWSVNPHGINMALVWLSGRTALCLTLFSVLTAIAVLERRFVWAALGLAAALASKEEAVLLPLVLIVWATERRDWRLYACLAVPVGLYFFARSQTAAFVPGSAPSFYQFTFSPVAVFRNILEYADRSATASCVVVVLAAVFYRMYPRIDHRRSRMLVACACWVAAGYALTIFLPVRSSLYAVFPSVGAAIAAATLVESMRDPLADARAERVPFEVMLAASLLLLLSSYRARNDRWVEPARFSQRTLDRIEAAARAWPSNGTIILRDEVDPRASFASAFGTFATEAVRLRTGRAFDVWIDPPPSGWLLAGMAPPDNSRVIARFSTHNGTIVQTQ